MVELREVVVTVAAIKSLTILEVARASATVGVKRTDTERLLRALADPDGDPAALEQGAELLYAWAWQLVRRDEPATTWLEAQSWRVTFDLETDDPIAEAEAEARVAAAVATGLPPAIAGELTMADMGAYATVAANAEKASRR